MSYSISTLLIRNLDHVFAENDLARRRAAIDEVFHEDVVYYDRSGTYRGRDEIQRIAGVYRGSHPELRYRRSAPPEELGDGGRVRWASSHPSFVGAFAGTDFIIARDGRIAAVYRFIDS